MTDTPTRQPTPPSSDAVLREALETIADWRLPQTDQFWDEQKTRPMSYEAAWGSNGARDYMRKIARAALSSAPSLAAGLSLEAIARVIEPQAWAALGVGDSYAYKNRRTSSLRKAEKIAALSSPAAGSDGWPLDNQTLDRAAQVALAFRPGDPIARAIYNRIRALKSAAPTPSTASGGE